MLDVYILSKMFAFGKIYRDPAKPAIKLTSGSCQPDGYKSDLGSPSREPTHCARVCGKYNYTPEF